MLSQGLGLWRVELAFPDNFVVRYHKDLVPKTLFLLSAVGLPSWFDVLGNISFACIFREISLLRRHSNYNGDTLHTTSLHTSVPLLPCCLMGVRCGKITRKQ